MENLATGTTELIESGEQRDALGRRRYPKLRRAELLAAFQRSGLTVPGRIDVRVLAELSVVGFSGIFPRYRRGSWPLAS